MWYTLSALSTDRRVIGGSFVWPGVPSISAIAQWVRDGVDENVVFPRWAATVIERTWPDGSKLWRIDANLWRGALKGWQNSVLAWTCCTYEQAMTFEDLLRKKEWRSKRGYEVGILTGPNGQVVV